MIFENSTGQQKTQPAMTNNNQQSQPLYQAPPAYGSSYFYPATSPSGTNVVFLREDEHRRRRRRLLLFAGIFFILLVGTFRWSRGDGGDDQWRANPEDYPIPDNVDLNHCTEGDQWSNIHTNPLMDLPHTAETHFDLPLSSDTLFFIERGDLSGGTATIKADDQLKEDQVHVKVVIHYRHDWVRDWAKVCQTTRGPNENGIGIFTPRFRTSRPRNARLLFDITISLPPSRSQHVIKKFETELHNTNHRVETLRNYVFDTIDLQGTNGGIVADDIVSTKGDIHTTNGHIKGAFHTTNSLTIKSTNGGVNVDVGAIATKSVTPKVVVSSTNGDLQAAFRLTSSSKIGGEFDITTSTTNSKLDVQFPVQPLDSVLRFKGTTTNGQAKLLLNTAFEGKFEGHTTNAQGTVEVDRSASDPSGKNRKRNVSIVQTKNRNVSGSTYWSDNRDVEGTAYLKTSNGRLTLQL